jgi:hypothetical protein
MPKLAVVLICLAAACASSSRPHRASETNRNVLTPAELQALPDGTILDAVLTLRPEYLRSRVRRDDDASTVPGVYIDGARSELAVLGVMFTAAVTEIRYLGAREATLLYGINHSAGAIVVTTR